MTSGILESDRADFWHTGVFGHGEFENDVEIRKCLHKIYRNVDKIHILMKCAENGDSGVIDR
jgi:hypothetical protein